MSTGEASPYDLLVRRVEELERRVRALEDRGAQYGQTPVSFIRPQPDKPYIDGLGKWHEPDSA